MNLAAEMLFLRIERRNATALAHRQQLGKNGAAIAVQLRADGVPVMSRHAAGGRFFRGGDLRDTARRSDFGASAS